MNAAMQARANLGISSAAGLPQGGCAVTRENDKSKILDSMPALETIHDMKDGRSVAGCNEETDCTIMRRFEDQTTLMIRDIPARCSH